MCSALVAVRFGPKADLLAMHARIAIKPMIDRFTNQSSKFDYTDVVTIETARKISSSGGYRSVILNDRLRLIIVPAHLGEERWEFAPVVPDLNRSKK
jgi:hypothetical protein